MIHPSGVLRGMASTFTNPTIIQIQQLIKGLNVSNTINVLR